MHSASCQVRRETVIFAGVTGRLPARRAQVSALLESPSHCPPYLHLKLVALLYCPVHDLTGRVGSATAILDQVSGIIDITSELVLGPLALHELYRGRRIHLQPLLFICQNLL